ncbi:MAG TPA: MASE1 domain-containing protein, partial [Vicinamibacterales bacterium]|nr:MASE1 domain-containing protein [Vicinamibacterales bacterium]
MAESRFSRGAMFVLLAAVYIVAGRLSLLLAFANANASPVWPPTGLAIGALLVLGLRAWPAIAVGAFIVNLTNSGDVVAAFLIAVGNTLEAVAAAWLTLRYARGRAAFNSTRNVLRFVAISANASTIAASIGTVTVVGIGLGPAADAGNIWLTWWLGDTVGAIVVAPLIVLWERRPLLSDVTIRIGEMAALIAALGLASFAVFSPWPSGRPDYPFILIPVLLWSAFRFGAWITALGSAFIVVIAVDGTLRGSGPFRHESPNESLLLLQAFVGLTTTMMLSVAAEVSRRRSVERDLRMLNERLERKVASRTDELQKANERLIQAQEVAHMGSWEWDVGANRVWWSDEMYRIYGIAAGTFIGYETFLEHVHPDDRSIAHEIVSRAMMDTRPFTFDHRIVRPDGTVRVIHANGRVICDAVSHPIRMVGTGVDITERKEAEEARAQLIHEQARRQEAEETSRAKDQFLAVLSHELRTPLNAALGWAHMLRELPRDAPATRHAVDAIYRNMLIQSRLVSDIVDVSRITKGALTVEKAPVDLAAIIESAMEMVRESARARNIALETCVAGDRVALLGDAKRLEQVFWNLLSNGIRFGREGGFVRVASTVENGAIRVTVEDDGPGIDPAFLPHVFEPFRQADASPRRAHDGLGLGLSIARHLVELHGGNMSAANRPGG